MRSLLLLVVFSGLVGLALGATLGYYQASPWEETNLLALKPADPDDQEDQTAARAKAELLEDVFNFGKMERGATMNHAFQLRNVGEAPLKIEVVNTTCKCTVGELADSLLPPGAQTEVVLEWTAKTPPGPFRHGATLATNDPKNSTLALVVEGEVVESTSVIPGDLLFGNVSTGATAQSQLFLVSEVQDDVQVTGYRFLDPDLEEKIKLEITAATPDEFPVPDAKSAAKVSATLNAGEAIGRFRGWLELETNIKKVPKISVLVSGNIIGDISIFGPGWSADRGLLRMGAFSTEQGKSVRLNVSTRGEHAKATAFEVASTNPPELKATLGEPRAIGDELVHVPLIVELPAGTSPMVRQGEPASSDASIVLSTTHPNAAEVKLRVRFTVEP